MDRITEAREALARYDAWQESLAGGTTQTEDMLASALRALMEPPADEEREALAQTLHNTQEEIYPVGLSVRAQKYRGQADAVFAAGFRRQGPVTEPPTDEWEYGCRQGNGYVASVGAPWMDEEFARKVSANDSAVMGVRRRITEPGPWEVVPDELG